LPPAKPREIEKQSYNAGIDYKIKLKRWSYKIVTSDFHQKSVLRPLSHTLKCSAYNQKFAEIFELELRRQLSNRFSLGNQRPQRI
jgi:hypothetical protein